MIEKWLGKSIRRDIIRANVEIDQILMGSPCQNSKINKEMKSQIPFADLNILVG